MNSILPASPSSEPRAAQPPVAEEQLVDLADPSAKEAPLHGEHRHGARGQRADADAGAAAIAPEPEGGESPVNYDESALLEIEIEGTDYRLDVGRAGTALCISTRSSGTWSWAFRGEAKWQNNVLRCKAFDRAVLSQLGTALAEAANDSQS